MVSEISRLQNSLNKLHETQAQLKEYVEESKGAGESDPEILQAIEDNVVVMYVNLFSVFREMAMDNEHSLCSGSQQERISILKMALSEKGIVTSGAHYDQQGPKENHDTHTEQPTQESTTAETAGDDEEGGVYL